MNDSAALSQLEAALEPGRAEPEARELALSVAWQFSKKLQAEGRAEDYIKVLRALVRARPGWAKARSNLVRALMGQARFEEAAAALPAEGGSADSSGERLFLMARLEESSGRLDSATALYRGSLRVRPRLEVTFHLAQNLLRRGETGAMFSALRRARSLYKGREPEDLDERLDRFRLAMCLCDYEEAFRLGESILDKTRELRRLEVLRWPVFIAEFDLTCGSTAFRRKAVSELDAFLARDPANPWGYYFRSILNASLMGRGGGGKKLAAVRADLAQVKRLAGARRSWMRLEVGKRMLYDGDLTGALEEFSAVASATKPAHWLAQCQIAEILLCLGDRAGAFKALEAAEGSASEIDRGCVRAWKGELYLWTGDYRRALLCLRAAERSNAQYVHCWKGGALVGLKRYHEALAALAKAAAISPWDIEARVWKAEALYRMKRFSEARAAVDDAFSAGGRANFYCTVLRALVRRALGDARGFRSDFARLPSRVLAAVGAARSDAARVRGLERILRLSRGVRRGGYEPRVWMSGFSRMS